ncbi:reticulophagy regulator 1 isoform X2 [Oryzias latipes]
MLRTKEAGIDGGTEAAAGHPEPVNRLPRREDTHPGRAGWSVSGLVSWRQSPCRTSAAFTAANAAVWFVAFSSFRTFSLMAILLALPVVTVTARDAVQCRFFGFHSQRSMTASWEIIDPGEDSRTASGLQFSDSLKIFLQETSAFKQQNPGKFCLLVCSLCTFFAVLGRYIPGIVISYILVKRLIQAQTEKDGVESDLSLMFPKLDSTVCKEMCVSDTEVSDVTWTDNGTFTLSEGHTPQTENSEDLDKEEAFTGGLADFPSLDNGTTTNGDDDDLSLSLPCAPPQQPSKRALFSGMDQHADKTLELVNQMAEDVLTAAVTAAIQERIEAAVCAFTGDPEPSRLPQSERLLELMEESDSEVEDFELLDQSELEQLEGELGLGEEKLKSTGETQMESEKPASSGFFSKLLRRH